MARVEVHWDALKGGNWLLLLLLLELSALVHCMLGLLVERIGRGRLSWHVAGIQSNSLHRTEEASRSHKRQITSSRKSWDLRLIVSDCSVITLLSNGTTVFLFCNSRTFYLDVRLYLISLYISDCCEHSYFCFGSNFSVFDSSGSMTQELLVP